MIDAKTMPAKYIFLDVVGFSRNRSVEAQTDIVHSLNEIVKDAIKGKEILEETVIYLPTGDGLCIALLNIEDPFDIHMQIALDILKNLHEYNEAASDEMRKFQVRIGVNANTDNLVTDINGNRNIAGAGINMAQRVMSSADGNQILVGQSVFETLNVRESYIRLFKSFKIKVKHGERIQVHQFINSSSTGLNTNIPQVFREKAEPKLTLRVACYFAHLIQKKDLLLQRVQYSDITKKILLWLLARDSAAEIHSRGMISVMYRTYKAGLANFDEQYDYYFKTDDDLAFEMAEQLQSCYLLQYWDCFADNFNFLFLNEKGKQKLKQEWPAVWDKFKLDNYT